MKAVIQPRSQRSHFLLLGLWRTPGWLVAAFLIVSCGSSLAQCPTNKTVECGLTWTFDPPTGTGLCTATNPPVVTVLGTTTNYYGCLYDVTRAWQVSDVCGNSIMCSQTVTISDRTPPVATCSTNKTVQCSSNWTFDPPTAFDSCCGTNVTISVFSTTTNGSCPPTIIRTWQVTDCCGNHVFCSQTITAIDTIPPTIFCAPNKTVQLGTIWSFDAPVALDSCCGTNITISVFGTVTNAGPCGQNLTRTWIATDCCGNFAACSQTVTISSTQPPQVVSIYVPCGGTTVTITFSGPVTAASAQNLANYSVTCGPPNPVTQAILAGPQFVSLTLAQPVGVGCFITVSNLQDACGNTMPTLSQPLTCTAAPCAWGSSGTEYWLTFPGNLGPEPTNQPAPQLFITGAAGTFGTVAIPGLASPFTTNFIIPINGDVTVTLPREADLADANDLVQTNAVHVIASQPVAVYGFNSVPYSSDGYLGLATSALGQAYRVLTYKNIFPDVPELAGSQFAIVGTVDGTTLTIIPSSDVGLHAAGVPYNLTLMQGQTYQLRQTNALHDDVSGALVTADQPIAVFGSHLCANIPNTNVFFCDHLVEQLWPTDRWGTNFVSVTLSTRFGGDTFRFLALLTNTIVRTNGVALPAPLNQGDFAEVRLAANAHITADKPISVAQYANSSDFDLVQNSDSSMTLIPPTSLYGTSYTVYSPTNFPVNYFNLTVPLGSVSQISLDGGLIPAGQFTAIGGSGYAGARISVAPGRHTLSSSGGAFGVIAYGWNEYDAYSYPAGLCSSSASAPPVTFTCPPTNIVLQAGASCTAVVPNLVPQVGNAGAALFITQSPVAGTVVGPGNYPITITIIDQFGLQHTCVTVLTVTLNGPAGLQCPSNIVTACLSSAGRVVTFQPTVCNTNFSITSTPPSGSLFPPGVTTVTCTATGPGGTQQCTFTVTVNCLTISAVTVGGTVTLTWSGGGTLQQATNVVGPWLPLSGANSPFPTAATGARGFFRISQ
ncbi:MAG: HYR domain-containing protein [Verrucomicrobia bacterium]|nr:HYR domain-containing protein [Verrucomicrobiota bacterium]